MPPASDSPKPPPAHRGNGGEPPDPYDDPVGYLRAKGWKPLGIPTHQGCMWLDPTQPLVETTREEPIMAWHPPQTKGGKPVYRQVQCPTGDASGARLPGVRKVFVPPGAPVPMTQALQTQIERDLRAQVKAQELAAAK